MSTIWRDAFPPPRRLLTTSLGVISFGSSRASEGTRHSAISQTVPAVKVTLLAEGKYSAYGNPSKTCFRFPTCFAPSPQSTVQVPPKMTNATSSPTVSVRNTSPGCSRRTKKLMWSQPACCLRKWRSSPPCWGGKFEEWKRKLPSLKSPPIIFGAELAVRSELRLTALTLWQMQVALSIAVVRNFDLVGQSGVTSGFQRAGGS